MDNGNFSLLALVFCVLLAVGGITFSAKYWTASTDVERIQMIYQNKDLTPAQKNILVMMLTVRNNESKDARIKIADYFRDVSFRLTSLAEEELKKRNPRVHSLQRAADSFYNVSEAVRNPESDTEMVQLKLVRSFTLLESANVTAEELDLTKLPPIDANLAKPPIDVREQAKDRFSWSGFVIAMIGIIRAFLAGLKAWFDFKKAKVELNTAHAKSAAPSNSP